MQRDVRRLEERDAWVLGDCDIYWIMHRELHSWLAAFPAADHYTSDSVSRTYTCIGFSSITLTGLDAAEKQKRLTFQSGGTEKTSQA